MARRDFGLSRVRTGRIVLVALVGLLGVAPGIRTAAASPVGGITAAQVQQAPVIEDVKPGDHQVDVTVVVGDSTGPVGQVTVSARAVDLAGVPTEPVIATGQAAGVDRSNPVVVTVTGLDNDTDYAFTATDPDDPAAADYVLARVAGDATSTPIPADRIAELEATHARLSVTAVNDRGQGPDSDLSPLPPAADALVTLTTPEHGAVAHEIPLTLALVDLGPDDITAATIRVTYPDAVNPAKPPDACTDDSTTHTITCQVGPLAARAQQSFPLRFSTTPPAAEVAFTAVRTSSSPYPYDANDGTATITCRPETAHRFTCG